MFFASNSLGQALVRLPDVTQLKRLTTKSSDRAPDIPGEETTMDFFSGPGGRIITIYSFRGRKIAFSMHFNSNPKETYRVFVDQTGDGLFSELPKGRSWQIPGWAR
jgi:hypothetical protein